MTQYRSCCGDALFTGLYLCRSGAVCLARMRKERVPQEASSASSTPRLRGGCFDPFQVRQRRGRAASHAGRRCLAGLLAHHRQYGPAVCAIGLFHLIFRRKFLAISISRERRGLWNEHPLMGHPVLYVLRSSNHQVRGDRRVLLVFSYLVVPAVIAQMWCDSIRGRLLLGWLAAILASTGGSSGRFIRTIRPGRRL